MRSCPSSTCSYTAVARWVVVVVVVVIIIIIILLYYYYYNGSSIPSADAVGTVCLRYSWNSYPTHVAGLDEPARLSLLFGDSCKQTKNGCRLCLSSQPLNDPS